MEKEGLIKRFEKVCQSWIDNQNSFFDLSRELAKHFAVDDDGSKNWISDLLNDEMQKDYPSFDLMLERIKIGLQGDDEKIKIWKYEDEE